MDYHDDTVSETKGRMTRPDGKVVYAYALVVREGGIVRRKLGLACESESLFPKAVAWARATIGVDNLY